MGIRAIGSCVARPSVLSLVLLALLSVGCPAPDPSSGLQVHTSPDQLLDYNQFTCVVQPTLIRHCSYSACHGNVNHALRIYSAGKLRLGVSNTTATRDGTLTAAEVEGNFESASGLLFAATAAQRTSGDVASIPLLGKPLAARFGGAEHHGVAVFPVYPAVAPEQDPEWRSLLAWVAGAKQPNPVDSDCAELFSELNLAPRKP